MAFPPIFRIPSGWGALMNTPSGSPDQLKVLIDIYNQLVAGVNNTVLQPVVNSSIAVAGNTISLGGLFVGQTVLAVLAVDTAGNVVPISTLLANPMFTNGTVTEKVGLIAAINNPNMQNNAAMMNWPPIASANIDINLIPGHNLATLVVITA